MLNNPYSNLGLLSPSPETRPRRIVVSTAGEEKTGKTHFACTGRPPIVLVNLDLGDEGVLEKFQSAGKEVYTYNIPVERPTRLISSAAGASQDMWKRQWLGLNDTIEKIYALKPGTVIIDTLTEAYELIRLAHFGKVDQVLPIRYQAVFAEMQALVRQAYFAHSTSTVFIHKLGVDYDTKEPKPLGWKEADFFAQVNLRHFRTPPDGGKGMDTYSVKVKDCRQNPHLNGIDLHGAQCTLEYLEWSVLDWRPENVLEDVKV